MLLSEHHDYIDQLKSSHNDEKNRLEKIISKLKDHRTSLAICTTIFFVATFLLSIILVSTPKTGDANAKGQNNNFNSSYSSYQIR